MRLSKNNLLIIWIIPIILGLIIILNFWTAINELRPRGMTTSLIFNQLAIIGAGVFMGMAVYWSILMYYIYLLQENEVAIQNNFAKLAGSGTSHLENAKKLITKVLEGIKINEDKLKNSQNPEN
ncbi:MAG TPA: hypothetical protein VIO11_02250 [Candidatus Methanoperedens sp.]